MLTDIPLVLCLLLLLRLTGAAVLKTAGGCSKSTAAGESSDPASKTVAATIVFEGTMVEMVRISNPEGPGLPKISAAKFIVEKVHKGNFPTSDGFTNEAFRPVFLRVEPGCVQKLKRNQKYFVFLSSSWDSVVGHEETLHWASGAPVKYSKKVVKEVLGHICKNCAHPNDPIIRGRLFIGSQMSPGAMVSSVLMFWALYHFIRLWLHEYDPAIGIPEIIGDF